MNDDNVYIIDYAERRVRLTAERRQHILEHPEMSEQFARIVETIETPELVVTTLADETVQVYHRYYETTPVASKFLLVAVKILPEDAFVLTAFFSRREKKGRRTWKA